MFKTSLVLRNLRGVVILLILAFHSFVACVAAQPTAPFPFDNAPTHGEDSRSTAMGPTNRYCEGGAAARIELFARG
jgi:hypothetical protein